MGIIQRIGYGSRRVHFVATQYEQRWKVSGYSQLQYELIDSGRSHQVVGEGLCLAVVWMGS